MHLKIQGSEGTNTLQIKTIIDVIDRHEICQKFYTTRFLLQKLYTLEMCRSGLILSTIKYNKFQYEWLIEMKM